MGEEKTNQNKVFYPWSDTPLAPAQLVLETGADISEEEMVKRISGQLCYCRNGGKFELYPKDHPDVVAREKRYM